MYLLLISCGKSACCFLTDLLLVEDNELNRDILSSFLEEKFDVFLAENGEEGLELLSEHYRELSVVLVNTVNQTLINLQCIKR